MIPLFQYFHVMMEIASCDNCELKKTMKLHQPSLLMFEAVSLSDDVLAQTYLLVNKLQTIIIFGILTIQFSFRGRDVAIF